MAQSGSQAQANWDPVKHKMGMLDVHMADMKKNQEQLVQETKQVAEKLLVSEKEQRKMQKAIKNLDTNASQGIDMEQLGTIVARLDSVESKQAKVQDTCTNLDSCLKETFVAMTEDMTSNFSTFTQHQNAQNVKWEKNDARIKQLNEQVCHFEQSTRELKEHIQQLTHTNELQAHITHTNQLHDKHAHLLVDFKSSLHNHCDLYNSFASDSNSKLDTLQKLVHVHSTLLAQSANESASQPGDPKSQQTNGQEGGQEGTPTPHAHDASYASASYASASCAAEPMAQNSDSEGFKKSENWNPHDSREDKKSENWRPTGPHDYQKSENWNPHEAHEFQKSENWHAHGAHDVQKSENWAPYDSKKSENWAPPDSTYRHAYAHDHHHGHYHHHHGHYHHYGHYHHHHHHQHASHTHHHVYFPPPPRENPPPLPNFNADPPPSVQLQ